MMSPAARRAACVGAALLALLGSAGGRGEARAAASPGAGAAPDTAAGATADTVVAWSVCIWRAEGAGESLTGALGWLRADGAGVRVEIARDGPEPPAAPADARLLQRAGQGWTWLAPVSGSPVLWRWGGGLETVAPGWRERLETVLRLLEAGPAGALPELPPGGRWLCCSPGRPAREGRAGPASPGEGFRLRLSPAPNGHREAGGGRSSPFRRALEARGWGRGGAGEVWTGVWRGEGEQARLCLDSSRWLMRLEVTRPRCARLRLPAGDLWAPIWSLGELASPVVEESDAVRAP